MNEIKEINDNGYNKSNKTKWIRMLIFVGIAILSFALLSRVLSNPDNYKNSISKLTEKQETVMTMTAVSASASAAITLLPGDIGTPIAEKLADLSGYFVVIYGAVLVEKYLITIGPLLAFGILIPIGCLLLAFLWRRRKCREITVKLFVFAFVIWIVIPCSVGITGVIDSTYENSINENLETIEENVGDINEAYESAEDDNILQKLFNTVTGKISEGVDKIKSSLSKMVESVAVMMVTCCVIPIAVLFFLIWIIKMLFGFAINIPIPKGSRVVKTINARRGR